MFASESGVLINLLSTYATTDRLSVIYDGFNVTYQKNGITLRTVAVPVAHTPMFMDSSFYNSASSSQTCGVNTLQFGPGTHIQLADTSQIGPNAATDIYSSEVAGPYGSKGNPALALVVTSVALTAPTNGTVTALCTFLAGWNVSSPTIITSNNNMWLELTSPLIGSKIVYAGDFADGQSNYTLQLVGNMSIGDTITAKLWYQQETSTIRPTVFIVANSINLRVESVKR